VVDPRVADHSKLVATAEYCRAHPAEAASRAVGAVPGLGQGLALLNLPPPPYVVPRHLRVFVDDDLIDALLGVDQDSSESSGGQDSSKQDSSNESQRRTRWEQWWKLASLRAEEDAARSSTDPSSTPRALTATDTGRVTTAAEAAHLLRSCSLIVGFHPDSATEPAVDLALKLRVPFVVCPCCVFPSLFKERLLNGRKVTSYDDFMAYLKSKHPRMREGALDFGGSGTGSVGARNRVLYMRREDY
jgi:hypothetical protein